MAVHVTTNAGDEYFKSTGSGTLGDPHVPHNRIDGTVDVSGSAVSASVSGTVDVSSMPDTTTFDGGPSETITTVHSRATLSAGVPSTLIAPPGAGLKIRIYDVFFSTNTADEFIFGDDSPKVFLAGFFLGDNGIDPVIPRGFLTMDEDKCFCISSVAATATVNVTINYSIVSA